MSYKPCRTGVHICGRDRDEIEPVTIANYPTRSQAEANAAFERARAEAESDDYFDCVVDLMAAGDIIDDFRTTRQMLPRIAKAIAAATPSGSCTGSDIRARRSGAPRGI